MLALVRRKEEMAMTTFALEQITPQQAQDLLKGKNRHIRPTVVARYVRDMKAGNWAQNGETIKIDTNGDLLDGQHRLLAIAESGTTQELLVVRGLPPSMQETVDSGERRTVGDVLELRGEKHAMILGGVLRMSWQLARGFSLTANGPEGWPSRHELLTHFEADADELRRAAAWGSRLARSILRFSPSGGGTMFYLMAKKDEKQATAFLESVMLGTGLETHDPRLVLRDALIKDQYQPRRTSVETRIAWAIKAWNAHREGKQIAQLSWSRQRGEKFPEVK